VDVLKRHVRAVGIRKYNVTLRSERGKEGKEDKDGESGLVAMSERNESDSKNESDVEGRKKKQTWATVEDTTNTSNNDSPTDGKKEDVERAKKTNNGEETFKRSHSSDSGARKERQEKRNTPSKMLMTFLRTSLANLKEGSGDAANRLDRSPSSGGSSDEAASPLSGSPSSSGRRRSTLSLGRKSGSMYAPSRSAPLPAVEERQRSQSVARQEDGDGTTGSATTSPGSPQRAAVKKEATRRKAKSEDDEWKNVFGAEKAKTTEAKNEGEKRKQKNEDDKSEAKETSDLAAPKTQVVTSPRHIKKKEKEEDKEEETDSHTKPTKKNKKAKKENKN
jgi:hypothetical protein